MIPLSVEQVAQFVGGQVLLAAAGTRITGVSTDSRSVRPGELFIALVGQRLDGHRFVADALRAGAVACMVSAEAVGADASMPRDRLIVVEDTTAALAALAAAYRREIVPRKLKVISVTGSNGKTTTKLMIDHVLSAELKGRASIRSYNNHIGVPLTLLSVEADDDYVVVEIGMNAPGEIDFLSRLASPDIGVITSIGAAHLEKLGDIHAVAAEKTALLRHIRQGGLAAVNIDEPAIFPFLPYRERTGHRDRVRGEVCGFPGAGVCAGPSADQKPSGSSSPGGIAADVGMFRLCTVGRSPQADLYVACVEGDLKGTSFVLDGDVAVRLQLPGVHHATNAAMAYAVGRWMGLSASVIGERLYSFTAVAGRTRRIELGHLTLIDDCYNANPSSISAALNILAGVHGRRRVFIMGSMYELGASSLEWHRRIGREAAQAGVDLLITTGTAAAVAAEAAAEAGVAEVMTCDDAAHAADLAAARVMDGDVVLVKGSRVNGLEVVVERLSEAFSVSHGPSRAT